MTFSKAMNPASVQDVHSYLLTPNNSVSMSQLRTFLATGSLGSNPDRPIPLKAAKYDPSTDTVVLTPRTPLSSGTTYQIGAGRSIARTHNPNRSGPLLDLQGNAIIEGPGGIGGGILDHRRCEPSLFGACASALGRQLTDGRDTLIDLAHLAPYHDPGPSENFSVFETVARLPGGPVPQPQRGGSQ